MSIWLSRKSYLVTECTNEVPLMTVFTDYCTDLLPNALAGSPLLQHYQQGEVTFYSPSYFYLHISALKIFLTFNIFFKEQHYFPGACPFCNIPWSMEVLFISYSVWGWDQKVYRGLTLAGKSVLGTCETYRSWKSVVWWTLSWLLAHVNFLVWFVIHAIVIILIVI